VHFVTLIFSFASGPISEEYDRRPTPGDAAEGKVIRYRYKDTD